ncbi:MAG: hypothetical protein NZ108_04800 [Bacteroidia bacterium]|nr:hypothetical protein [Bacteroidia bacterium]
MLIANPIYDSVFKYLMQDLEIAKLLIASILEMEVIELDFLPQEYHSEFRLHSVYRVDFKAKIKTNDGSSLVVLIELQKIKFHSDTFRFRRYIGEQYASKNNMEGNQAIPIIVIYLLGHHLQVHDQIPIIRVKRQYLIHGTNDVLVEKEPFIEGITHDAIIIQIPAIHSKKGKKTELEKVLSIFDVALVRYLDFDESDYPVSHLSLIRKLYSIARSEETRKDMEIEETFLNDFRLQEETIEELQEQIEEARKRAEEEKKRAEEEKKRAEEEKKRAEEKEKLFEEEKKRAEEIEKQIEEIKEKERERTKQIIEWMRKSGKKKFRNRIFAFYFYSRIFRVRI